VVNLIFIQQRNRMYIMFSIFETVAGISYTHNGIVGCIFFIVRDFYVFYVLVLCCAALVA